MSLLESDPESWGDGTGKLCSFGPSGRNAVDEGMVIIAAFPIKLSYLEWMQRRYDFPKG